MPRSTTGKRTDRNRRAHLSAVLDALAVSIDESNLVRREVGRRELSIHVAHGEHLIRRGIRVHAGPEALSPLGFSGVFGPPAQTQDTPLLGLSASCFSTSLRTGEKKRRGEKLVFCQHRP